MTAKVRIKAGPIEFEYEGETELGVTDIKDLFSHIEKLFKVPILAEGGESHPPAQTPAVEKPSTSPQLQKLHVNSIATKLKAKTATDVALAAAASLQLMDGKDTFSRTELLATMKTATMHYKENMSGNLSSILKTLVGSKLNQIADGVYSLNADEYQNLASQLA
jgi:hypothetical protein